jgi:hypothetical protein
VLIIILNHNSLLVIFQLIYRQFLKPHFKFKNKHHFKVIFSYFSESTLQFKIDCTIFEEIKEMSKNITPYKIPISAKEQVAKMLQYLKL